ncbi:hypothetical protein OG775_11565 [Streptomyces platensis]|uniref:hypothetical protein n=1 Tax=Streptomyces platensis TaxID=58346 RepID=UPI0022577606|nr:hypothetical protein [Streptomyces platensis]MCX4635763.1 hypothetical protein [Streptomyces platensis]
MRNIKKSAAYRVAALSLALVGGAMTAPSAAAAGSGKYISFSNKGWFIAETCYHWASSTTPDSCDKGKAIGTDWRVEIPDDAQGVKVEVTVDGQIAGDNVSPHITDLSSSHCYELSGYTWGPKRTDKAC